jgi:hypothetical protein
MCNVLMVPTLSRMVLLSQGKSLQCASAKKLWMYWKKWYSTISMDD